MRLIALVAAAMLTTGIAAAPASANGYPPHGWHGGPHHGWHGHHRDWHHHHRGWRR